MNHEVAHELVTLLKQAIQDHGGVPHKHIFYGLGPGLRGKVERTFGLYSELVKAAGHEPNARGRKKDKPLGNEIFQRELAPILEAHVPSPMTFIQLQTVMCIPDVHFPFHSQRVLDAIYKKVQREKPSFIVQLGDLYDLYAHSKFPRSLNLYSPVEEESLARAGAQEMWTTLRSLSPNSHCVQIKGNHDIRPVRRTMERQPEVEHIVSKHLDGLMSFDGVELVSAYRDEYVIDNVMYHHGYRTKLGDHRDYVVRNFVCGHTHRGGVAYRRLRGEVIWELNAGFAGDPEAKVFGYMPQKTCDYTPGFGYIDEEGPRFISC